MLFSIHSTSSINSQHFLYQKMLIQHHCLSAVSLCKREEAADTRDVREKAQANYRVRGMVA